MENPFFRAMTRKTVATSEVNVPENPFFRGTTSNTNNIKEENVIKTRFYSFKKEDISKGGEAFLRAMACNSSSNIQEMPSTAAR